MKNQNQMNLVEVERAGGAWNADVVADVAREEQSFHFCGPHNAPSPSTIGPSKRNKISAATGSTVIAKTHTCYMPRGSRVRGESLMATGLPMCPCAKKELKWLGFYFKYIVLFREINNRKFYHSSLFCLLLQIIFLINSIIPL